MEVEPDEVSDIEFDFIIDVGVRVVRVHTFIENKKKRRLWIRKRKLPIGWNLATIYDVQLSQPLPRSIKAAGGECSSSPSIGWCVERLPFFLRTKSLEVSRSMSLSLRSISSDTLSLCR